MILNLALVTSIASLLHFTLLHLSCLLFSLLSFSGDKYKYRIKSEPYRVMDRKTKAETNYKNTLSYINHSGV